jgi:tetratricopeptide (TPR) repeat protein/tRNA A-37 threonylcarbamoyl transferase component Bud32
MREPPVVAGLKKFRSFSRENAVSCQSTIEAGFLTAEMAMNERPPLDATEDVAPASDDLDAALAAAFGPDSGPAPPAGGSVVQALSAGLPAMPRVLLREPESFGGSPVVRPASEEMPDKPDPGARLQLHGEIARGGMGAVFKGHDSDLGRDVAVKVLLETHQGRTAMLQRFLEEAQISGQLQHPGIAPVYELGQFADKRPYFTMKLVKGKTLAMLLAARKSPEEERTRFLDIFAKICQTLAYAHARGVIHRDLKPSNVMVGAFGEVQVMDWGLAKVLKEGGIADEHKAREGADVSVIRTQRGGGSSTQETGSRTQAGTILGTPAYMAPEQARGDVDLVDERADVFGLGAILCEMLTGQPPYVGMREEIADKSRKAELADAFARLEDCAADRELIALTRQCLAAQLWQRPRHAGEVAERVTAYQQSVAERLRQAELAETEARARAGEEAKTRAEAEARLGAERRARRLTLSLAAAVVALLLGGGAFAFWRNDRNTRNAEAVAALLGQAEEALQADDTAKAQVALEAATKRSAEGGAEKHAERLGRLGADLALLRDLDAVDVFRWTLSGNDFPDPKKLAKRTREAVARFGADPETVSVDEAAARVSASVVRPRIVLALDRLLREGKSAGVRTLLRQLDAEPYRDAVRDGVLADDRAKIEKLARRKTALEQPPGFAAFMGESGAIAPERRRQLLQAALRRRPGDLRLLMTLGYSYLYTRPGSPYLHARKETADERLRWYQAAAAAAPANAAAHGSLGVALFDKGQVDEAIACYRKAIELYPTLARVHNNLGLALLARGQVDEGVACCKKAIALDPKNAVAHNILGSALGKKGRFDEAIACYRKAIALDPKLAQAHNNLGLVLAKRGQVDEAIACYRKAIALDPKNALAHDNLGWALAEKRQWDEAIACLRKAIALDPRSESAHASLGLALAKKGQVDEAIACFKKAIALDPKLADTHFNLGVALFDKGQVDEAIACYKKAIEVDSKLAIAHYNLGVALKDKGQVDEAIACYRKAIALDPKNALAHNNLGNALRDRGRVDEAIACYKKASEIDLKYALAYSNLGHALRHQKKLPEAIAAYHKAIALDPKDAKAHNGLGAALAGKGRWDQAIACYKKAIALDPKDARTHYNLGNALLRKRQLDEAIACYKKAIALDPKLAVAHAGLGDALAGKGQVEEAMACYHKAIALDPKNAQAHTNLGVVLAAKGQVDEAIACYKKAIEVDSKFAAAHNNLGGILCEHKRDYDAGIACYRKAIEFDPKLAQAHTGLGWALAVKGQVDEGIACLKKAIALDPKQALAHNNLGFALTRKGQVDEAIACYQKAIELDPKNAKAHFNLGSALYRKGQLDAAIACYKKAIALDPKSAWAHYNLGNALLRKRQLDEAVASYRKAIEIAPNDAQAHCNLGQALQRQGRFAEALAAYRRGHELGTMQRGWRYPSALWVRQAERLAALEAKLPAFLKGEFKPTDFAERLSLAQVCRAKKLHHAAARLYLDAFADPKTPDNLKAVHRYNAACCAALAAAGRGEDAAKLDDQEKARLRKQALDWLRADLSLRTRQLETAKPAQRVALQQALRYWQKDTDLAGLRDKEAIAKLPAPEQKAFTQFWADVAALVKKAGQETK